MTVLTVLAVFAVLAALTVFTVLRIAHAIVKLVIVEALIVVRHFKFLLFLFGYRSSMEKTHKKYAETSVVLWYCCDIDFL